MNPTLPRLSVTVIALLVASTPATAQDKGFDVIRKSPKPQAPIIVGKPKPSSLVKMWPVNQEGEPSQMHKGCSVVVEKIELMSNDRMRWHFAIYNRGSEDCEMEVDIFKSYLSDSDGETYKPVARQYPPNHPNRSFKITVRQKGKVRWWLEYKAPAQSVNRFTVGTLIHFNPGCFRPFDVVLEEDNPIGPKEEMAAPVPPIPPNPVPPGPEPSKPDEKTPAPEEPKAKKASPPGPTYEGDANMKGKGRGHAGLTLASRTGDDPGVRARMFSPSFNALCLELIGRQIEEPTKSGVGYVLIAQDGSIFRFSQDGNLLSGTDSHGNRFSFRLTTPPPNRVVRR